MSTLTPEAIQHLKQNPSFFAKRFLNFNPFSYQEKLLNDPAQRIIACMGRQTGKTTTIATKAIHYAYTHPKTTTLIISPSLRQSMIMFDKILTFTHANSFLRRSVTRKTRTIIQLSTGSQIIALPCSEHLLRGYTAHLAICVPSYTKITLANGEETAINRIQEGSFVLSFNERTHQIEPKKVLKVFRRTYEGPIIKITHENGCLACTPTHKIIKANGEHTAAMLLMERDKLLYLPSLQKVKRARRQKTNDAPRAVSVWWTLRRFISVKNNEKKRTKKKEQRATNTTFLKTSRIRSIQILDNKRFCQNTTANSQKQRLGKRVNAISYTCLSRLYSSTLHLLQKRKKISLLRMAQEDNASFSLSHLVHGRWQSQQKLYGGNQHSFIHFRRTDNASKMAQRFLETHCQDKERQQRKRLLLAFSRQRQRPLHGLNQTTHKSKHELQNDFAIRLCCVPNLRSILHSATKRLCYVSGNWKKTVMSKSKMQEKSTPQALLQSFAETVQNMRNNFYSSHREPDNLQQELQSSVSSTAQEGIESRLPPEEEITEVYNLTVEHNHNYFANGVLLGNCDEASFIPESIITEILFPMLSTTNGTAILLSTPWDKNHFFYKAFLNPQYSTHKIRSSENPLIPQAFLAEMQQNMTTEAYKREYLAEFTEAATSYFPQELIRQCIEHAQRLSLEPYATLEQQIPKGEYYAGLDLGKLQDHSALAIAQREAETLKLVYTHEFPLETAYTEVIATTTRANTRFKLQKLLADQTGIGEPILEELQTEGITAEGAKLTQDAKTEILTHLKLTMQQQRLAIPYDKRLCQQINDQQYAYTRNGKLSFSHPPNTHDDQLWALALAVYAAKTPPQPQLWIVTKANKGKNRLNTLRQRLQRHKAEGTTR